MMLMMGTSQYAAANQLVEQFLYLVASSCSSFSNDCSPSYFSPLMTQVGKPRMPMSLQA